MRERRKASGSNVGAERRGWSWESGWRDGRSREPAGEEGEDGGEGSGGLWGDDGSSIREVVDFGMAGDDEWMREIKTTQPASLHLAPNLISALRTHFGSLATCNDIAPRREHITTTRAAWIQDENHIQSKLKIENQKSKIKHQQSLDITKAEDFQETQPQRKENRQIYNSIQEKYCPDTQT